MEMGWQKDSRDQIDNLKVAMEIQSIIIEK